jgi:DNA-binding CsgD family transcriptional regulator
MARKTQSDPMDEVVRLLALQVRSQIGDQKETIIALKKAGIAPARIADLLGINSGTVAKAQASKRRKPRK